MRMGFHTSRLWSCQSASCAKLDMALEARAASDTQTDGMQTETPDIC